MTKYFALVDRDDLSVVRNVFIVDQGDNGLVLASWNHMRKNWEKNTALIADYIGGNDSDLVKEVSRETAARLAAEFGKPLPDEATLADLEGLR